MADDIRRELVFEDGGRPYNNLDFESIQTSINDAQEIFNQFLTTDDENSWIINGFDPVGAAVGQAGIVWLNGRMRYVEAANVDFVTFNPLYIGALPDGVEARLYKDGNVKTVFNLYSAQWLTETQKNDLGLLDSEVIRLTSEDDIEDARFKNSALVSRLIVKQSSSNTTKVNISGAVNLVGVSGLNVYRQSDDTIAFQQGSVEGFPSGGIIMFSGTLSASIFNGNGTGLGEWDGWQLCNGLNTSPDLRDRFVVGSTMNRSGGAYAQGATGGANSVTLSTGQLAAHNHTINGAGSHSHSVSQTSKGTHNHSGTTTGGGSHNHTATTSSTGAHTHGANISFAGTHTHTITVATKSAVSAFTNSTGAHSHTYSRANSGTTGNNDTGIARNNVSVSTSINGTHAHSVTIPAHTHPGSSASQNNGHDHGVEVFSSGIHAHTLTTSNRADHTHGYTTSSVGGHTHSVDVGGVGDHSHTSNNAGSGQSHENRPPYYALAYVMKI